MPNVAARPKLFIMQAPPKGLPADDTFRLQPPAEPPRKKIYRRRKPPVSLNDEQLLGLLRAARAHRVRDWVMILVTYWHGLRASETVNLRLRDFCLAESSIHIVRGKGSEGGDQILQVHDNPLLNERAAVAEWLASRKQFGEKGGRVTLRSHGEGTDNGATNFTGCENFYAGVKKFAGKSETESSDGDDHAVASCPAAPRSVRALPLAGDGCPSRVDSRSAAAAAENSESPTPPGWPRDGDVAETQKYGNGSGGINGSNDFGGVGLRDFNRGAGRRAEEAPGADDDRLSPGRRSPASARQVCGPVGGADSERCAGGIRKVGVAVGAEGLSHEDDSGIAGSRAGARDWGLDRVPDHQAVALVSTTALKGFSAKVAVSSQDTDPTPDAEVARADWIFAESGTGRTRVEGIGFPKMQQSGETVAFLEARIPSRSTSGISPTSSHFPPSNEEPKQEVLYVYRWDRMGRKGEVCRVLVRSAKNSCLVEFADGFRAVTSRSALRKADQTDRNACAPKLSRSESPDVHDNRTMAEAAGERNAAGSPPPLDGRDGSGPSQGVRSGSPAARAARGHKPPGGPEPRPDPPQAPTRAFPPPGAPTERIFPISRSQFWRLVHGYALAAGIPLRKCKTHMLKHTIAKHLVRAGHPLNEIQEWMGWSSIETMNWYTRADEEELGNRIGDTIRAKNGLRRLQQGSLF